MKLGRHLLETCRLRKQNARGRARAEAEWWEARILAAIEELKAVRQSPAPRPCTLCGHETTGGWECENGHVVCIRPACCQVGRHREIRRVICPLCARLLRER